MEDALTDAEFVAFVVLLVYTGAKALSEAEGDEAIKDSACLVAQELQETYGVSSVELKEAIDKMRLNADQVKLH